MPNPVPLITGRSDWIAHLGWPTHAFRAPLIYNPWFDAAGVACVVVPVGCEPAHYPALLRALFAGVNNLRGALVTMPHKVSTVALLDRASTAVRVAGACNAVRRGADGALEGELFDGEGFVRGLRRKGLVLAGARALVVGAGGVGSAIAASLAGAGVAELALADLRADAAANLAARLREHHPALAAKASGSDPAGFDLVVNATPMGMQPGDAMPLDTSRLDARTFVGEVVMARDRTAFLQVAAARGCRTQIGADMLYEQIPAYLEFFGLPTTTAERLRELSGADTPAGAAADALAAEA